MQDEILHYAAVAAEASSSILLAAGWVERAAVKANKFINDLLTNAVDAQKGPCRHS